MSKELLAKLVNVDGVAGFEQEVRQVMGEELSNFDIMEDNIGSFVAYKNGTEDLKLMLAGHLDEVGFMVARITDEGFIYMKPVGGWFSQVVLAQKFRITTRSGAKIHGVTGSTPPHILSADERNTPVKLEDIYLDLGVNSKEEVTNLGVNIGDMITPAIDFTTMNNPDYLMGKAFDNRVGCYIVCEVMNRLKDAETKANVYGVGTTSEEIGLRGAKTVTNLVKPDVAIAIDTTIDASVPKTNNRVQAKTGEGPVVLIMDASIIAHVGLRNYFLDLANELNIPVQCDFLSAGGTDAGAIHQQGSGVVALSFAIATRYLHSHTSMINYKDVENAIEMITEFTKKIDSETLKKIKS